ncbi:MAG: protein TolR [Gammaproteobacteria bacterium]|nr:MAG: protein TolR [Gammaproteobacteria bacterium]
MSEINVVPYIDVMLVLLVIFMVTTPMLQQGVDIDLPVASAAPIEETTEEPIVVEIDKNGHLFINNQENNIPLTPKELYIQIKYRTEKKPKAPVLIRGDKYVGYGKVVEVMAFLKKAGIPKVGLMTEAAED